MKFKLLLCLFLAASVILNPIAINNINAMSPDIISMDNSNTDNILDDDDDDDDDPDDQILDNPLDTDCQPTDSDDMSYEICIGNCDIEREQYIYKYEQCIIGVYKHTKGNKLQNTDSHHIISSSLCNWDRVCGI